MRPLRFLFLTMAVATACSDPVTSTSSAILTESGVASATSAADRDAPHYTPQLLPQLRGARWSAAFAINAAGVAAGVSSIPVEVRFPGQGGAFACQVTVATIFRAYDAQSLHTDLQQAMGVWSPCELSSIAMDINDRDEVVGVAWQPGVWGSDRGFLWKKASGVKLHHAVGPTIISALNNGGVTVGYFDRDGSNVPDLTYWWPNGGGTPPTLPFRRVMWGWDINNDGVTSGCWNYFAFKLDLTGRFTTNEEHCTAARGLLTLYDGRVPKSGGINGAGVAVYTNATPAPVMWGAGTGKGVPVGWSPGAATGISDRNRVVGWRIAQAAPLHLAMTRSAGGRILTLPGIPATASTEAYAVNRCGHVVGATFDDSNLAHAILWKQSRCDVP
ncbi:MAG: hypothetical protein IT359_08625 [Gemmatimonadaceae bacterium]|nr:hypothetical protein [Gemmatimonadaceae bacterium]